MNWTDIFHYFLTIGSGSGVIAYLGRIVIKQYFDKNIEAYRHQFQLITQASQIQYSKLHNDRADVIKILYQKLVTMEGSVFSYIGQDIIIRGELTRDEKQKRAREDSYDFFNHFSSNEIYFDEFICKIIGEMRKLYTPALNEAAKYDYADTSADLPSRKESYERWDKALAMINEKIPFLKEKLKEGFRKLLGVTTPNSLSETYGNSSLDF
ncbi:MAG: hypothetical protein ACHQQQ_15275 [Bacteroidota bacterium]